MPSTYESTSCETCRFAPVSLLAGGTPRPSQTRRRLLAGLARDGQTGSRLLQNRAATGVENAPFQNPFRDGTCKRLIFQHPSRAMSVFQKDLLLGIGSGSWFNGVILSIDADLPELLQ